MRARNRTSKIVAPLIVALALLLSGCPGGDGGSSGGGYSISRGSVSGAPIDDIGRPVQGCSLCFSSWPAVNASATCLQCFGNPPAVWSRVMRTSPRHVYETAPRLASG